MAGIPTDPSADPGRREMLVGTSRTLLRISVDMTAGRPVIALAGELDVATAPAVEAVFFETFDVHRRPHVVVDVARLSFCDCVGLSAFLHVRNRALAGGGWARLCGTGPGLRTVLGITGLMPILHCYPTAADAFADVERSTPDPRGQEHL
ncbi:STAS domain-containing protein [Catenulispora subtropica]|uniref:Anti-sigma factor antagonist n=1 Tax=Catenulispora subtropica TaxID=450798 RepID=A0ABN2TET3_9ACTN